LNSFQPGQHDIFVSGFGKCAGINFVGVTIEKFGISLDDPEGSWGAERFDLFYSDNSTTGCGVGQFVENGTFWCSIQDTLIEINGGGSRYLTKIEVGTLNLPDATSKTSQLGIVIAHEKTILCKTEFLNRKDQALQAGETKTFLKEGDNFGSCGEINFAGINLTTYGILHKGVEAWGADRFTLYFSDNSTEDCILNKFMKYSSQLWCDKDSMKKLVKIMFHYRLQQGKELDPNGVVKIRIDQHSKKLCQTDNFIQAALVQGFKQGVKNFLYPIDGFGDCELTDFNNIIINRWALIFAGKGWDRFHLKLFFSDNTTKFCQHDHEPHNELGREKHTGLRELWCDSGEYLAKIEIETAKNCATPPKHRPPRPPLDVVDVEIDPTRYKGDVLIRIEGNGEIFCETDRLSIGKGESCTDVFQPHDGFGTCMGKDFSTASADIERVSIVHRGSQVWEFKKFTLYFKNLEPFTCWGNHYLHNSAFVCEKDKRSVVQIEVKVSDAKGSGLSYTKSGPNGGMLVALANSRNVAEVCTTARLKKTFDKRRLWEDGGTYNFSGLDAIQKSDHQPHPVWGTCANWRFTNIDEIILHHFGNDDLTLDWVIFYLDNLSYIKCDVGRVLNLQQSNFQCFERDFTHGWA